MGQQLELDLEEWKPIEGYEGLYSLSSNGMIYNHRKNKYTFGSIKNNKKRPMITLSKRKKQVSKSVHKLMWETFVGPIPKGYEIHHKNFNPSDNRLENLELLSKEEHHKLHLKDKYKKVRQYTLDGEFVAEYKSCKDVERKLGFDNSNISKCCLGKRKDAYGYIWKRKEGE